MLVRQPPKKSDSSDRFKKFLKRNVDMLDTLKSQSAKDRLHIAFGTVAKQDSLNWIAQYYAAFSLATSSLTRFKDSSLRDSALVKALEYANKAEKLAPKESEVILLKGFVTGMRIFVDPTKGEKLGKETYELYAKAKKLNPENPRVYLMLGESAMYTPKENGGGKEKAIENLELSVKKFKAFKNADPTFPHWGAERANEMLEKAKKL
jgi:hypothetical protein